MKEILLNDTQFIASSIYSHDTDDDYVKREYAPPNARLNNEINGGKNSDQATLLMRSGIFSRTDFWKRLFLFYKSANSDINP